MTAREFKIYRNLPLQHNFSNFSVCNPMDSHHLPKILSTWTTSTYFSESSTIENYLQIQTQYLTYFPFRFSLGKVEDESFSSWASQVKLPYRDHRKPLCLFTDASDKCWSAFISQIPREQVGLIHREQHHKQLAFLSGHFNSTGIGWSTLEKEDYALAVSYQCWLWHIYRSQ